MTKEPRFYHMDLDAFNKRDVAVSLKNDDLIGIVDEKDGGIIAYAIGTEHADLIVGSLATSERTVKVDGDTFFTNRPL